MCGSLWFRDRDPKNIFYYQRDVENYTDQVLNFLLFERHEYMQTESSGVGGEGVSMIRTTKTWNFYNTTLISLKKINNNFWKLYKSSLLILFHWYFPFHRFPSLNSISHWHLFSSIAWGFFCNCLTRDGTFWRLASTMIRTSYVNSYLFVTAAEI